MSQRLFAMLILFQGGATTHPSNAELLTVCAGGRRSHLFPAGPGPLERAQIWGHILGRVVVQV